MDDVEIPQTAETNGPGWHYFHMDSYNNAQLSTRPQLAINADVAVGAQASVHASLAAYSQPATLPDPAKLVTLPGMPVFVLTTGTILSVSGYGYQDNRISYTLIGGGSGVINSSDVDWTATTHLNDQRGIRLTLHNPHPTATPGL
jgi:hypothetical protein